MPPGNEYDDLLAGNEPAAGGNEYVEMLNDEKGAQRSALQQSMFAAAQAEPDRKAKVLDLARRTDLPPELVDRNLEEVVKKDQLASTDYDQIIEKTPGLAKWLEDPTNAALGKDDLDALGKIESSARVIRPLKKDPFFAFGESNLDRAAKTGWNQLSSGAFQLAAAYGLMPPQDAAAAAAESNRRAQELRGKMPDYAKEFNAAMEKEGGDADKAFNQFLSSFHSYRKGHIKQALTDFVAGGAMTVGETIDMIASAASRPRGLTYSTVENLANSLPSLALGAGIGVGTGTGPLGFAAGAFMGAVPTEVGAWINDSLQKRGFDVTNPEDLMRAYSDSKLMTQIRGEAERKGLTTAGVDALFNAFVGKMLAKAKPGLASKAAAGVKEVGIQSVGESASEFAGQVAAHEGDLSKVNFGESIQEGIISLGHSVGDVVVGRSLRTNYDADPIEAANEVSGRTSQALEIQESIRSLVGLGEAVAQSRLAKRMPEKLRELVDLATQGDEPAAVYFQPDDWDSYWTRKGRSPVKAAEQILGDSKAYFEAKETGQALEVPLSNYIEKVAPTEDYNGLLPATRTSPDGMSLAEAKEHLETLPATMEELAREALGLNEPAPAPKTEEAAQEIAQGVSQQLQGLGYDQKTADTYSSIYEGLFKSLGERMGVDPKQLFDQYGLKINRPESVQTEAGQSVLEQQPIDEITLKRHEQARETESKTFFEKPETTQAYLDHPDTQGGKLLDTDMMRELYEPYSLNRALYNDSTSSPAGKAIAKLYEQQLKRPANPRKTVWIMGGGPGSGKSETLRALGPEATDIAELIYDSVSSDFERTKQRIDQAVAAGRKVHFRYVYNSLDRAMNFVEKRFREKGRPVSSDFVAQAHVDALETALKLAETYKNDPDVHIHVYDNSKEGTPHEVTIEDLRALRYTVPVNELVAKAKERLKDVDQEVQSTKERAAQDFALQSGNQETAGRGRGQGSEGDPRSDGQDQNVKKFEQSALPEPSLYLKSEEDPGGLVQKFMSLFQGGKGKARAQIRFGLDRKFSIDLFKNADLSSFLHETGHFYFEVMADVAGRADAPQQIKDDYQAILNWMGIESRDQVETKHHEMWARGFEAYLMEGKAPSQKLRQAFARLKVWLLSVYRKLKNLGVELTPQVRDVMNRMLATEEEINEVYAEQDIKPLFKDPAAMGMNEKQAGRYTRAREDARLAAEETVSRELLKDFQQKEAEFYKEKRKGVKEEVRTELMATRPYKALATLQGTLPGGENQPTFKISKSSLKDIGATNMPRGIGSPDGIHIEIAAEMLSFADGADLVKNLSGLPKLEIAAEAETNRRMAELYPDSLTDGTLPETTLDAVLNDKQSELLQMELEHLASNNLAALKDIGRRIVRHPPPIKTVRAQAAKIIASRKVAELKPHQFTLAARKARKQAGDFIMNGDIDQAFEAKRKELLNHELYRAAVEARDDISDSVRKFKKLSRTDEDLAKTRDVDMVNAARAVLANFGIGGQNADRYSAMELLTPMQQYDPDGFATIKALVDDAVKDAAPYKTITYDQFVAMKDAVLALWDLSKTSREIEIDGQKMDREQVKEELVARLVEVTKPGNRAGYDRAVDKWDRVKMGLLGIRAALRRVESWADAVDGGRGVFTKYVVTPISEATTQYRIAKKSAIQKYLDLVKGIEKGLSQSEIAAPEIGYKFKGKAELLGALLHSGNESNLSKLLRGRGWGDVDIEGNLDMGKWNKFLARMHQQGVLTKADWDFVQGIWDLLEELKPQAQHAHKQLYGYYFNEITANEVVTPYGTYRGGYVPAVADPFIAQDAQIRNEREQLEKNNNSFMFPTTGRGFTKSRVDAYAAPLSIDLSLVPTHIDKALRFIHIEPQAKAVGRIVMDKGFRKSLDAFDPTVGGDMLVPWLQRAAQQRIAEPSKGWGGRAADTIFREIRTRTGLQVMTLNVVNTLQQFTGISIAALKVKPKHLRNALWSYVRAPKVTAEMVTDKSDFMKTRMQTNVMEIQHTIDDLLLNPTKYEKARDFAQKHGYFLQSATQGIVDSITWAGAYDQAISEGATEIEAVRQADAAVRLTQGSFNSEDVSRFETGTPFVRAFTMFYSYFNMQANSLGTEFTKVGRDMGLKKGAGRALYIYTFGFMIPAVLSELLVQAMSGRGFDDDDDDQYLDDAMAIFFSSQFRTLSAMAPGLGPAVQSGINAWNDKWYDDRISTSPAVSMIESSVKAPFTVYKAATSEGSKSKAIKDTLSLLGLLTGLPVAPLGRPLGYLADVADDRANPEDPLDFARGLITGKPGKK